MIEEVLINSGPYKGKIGIVQSKDKYNYIIKHNDNSVYEYNKNDLITGKKFQEIKKLYI